MQINTDLHADTPVGYNCEGDKMRSTSVITYRRVSSKPQAKNGVSLDDQKQELDRFAVSNQLQIMEEFSDAVSASNEEKGSKRENFKAACRLALKNDWDILVTVPSRFTRTLVEFDQFISKSGRLICANLGMDANEEKIRNTLELEIIQNKQRQRTATAAQKRARAEGRFSGNPDLAPAREKSLQVRLENALQGYDKFELQLGIARASGAKTPKTIAAAFNKVGFKTPQNCRWKPNNVRRVLKSIAELKAAGALLSAAGTVPAGNDNMEQINSSSTMTELTSIPDIDDLDLEAGTPSGRSSEQSNSSPARSVSVGKPAAYPLTSDELAEFREFLKGFSAPDDQIEELIQSASNPRLTQGGRTLLLNWMAEERAA